MIVVNMSKPKSATNLKIPEDILLDLLTPSEVRMIKNRWKIISLIVKGLPVRYIAQEAKVGTDTVVRMSKKVDQNPKIRQYLSVDKLVSPSLQRSKWVFGQIGKEKEL